MAGNYSLEGLAVPEILGSLHAMLERVAENHPELAANDLMLFETAVIEIAGNVVEHGRPPGQVRYWFKLAVLPDRLVALMNDTGDEVPDPEGAPYMPDDWEETGRGLPLARAALDEMSYARGAEGNLWRMVKLCSRNGQHTSIDARSAVPTIPPSGGH